MIQTVVFDLGKVLVDFDYSIAARRIAARGQITAAALTQFINQSSLFVRYETGLVTNEEFYRGMCDATGFSGDFKEFGSFFGEIFVPIQPMIELHAALSQRGFPTYIFSNTNDLAVQVIRRSFPFFSRFNGYILSYQHGSMKPEPKLYEVVEQQSGRRGAEILYIDDRPENIAAGADRGWQVILQETPEKSRAAIEKLGLLNHAPR